MEAGKRRRLHHQDFEPKLAGTRGERVHVLLPRDRDTLMVGERLFDRSRSFRASRCSEVTVIYPSSCFGFPRISLTPLRTLFLGLFENAFL